jgi:hypothetical protein
MVLKIMTTKIAYNLSLLESIINMSNAILIGTYERLNRDTNIQFKCKCDNDSIKTFRSISRIGAICSDCTKLSQQEKKRITELNLYGVDNVMKLLEFKDKLKQTNLKKYGVEYPLQNTNIMNKFQNTVLQRYGVKHILQVEQFKEKSKETMIERYGVNCILQLDKIKNEIKQKNLKKYNVEYNLQANEIRDQIKNKILAKYGVEYYLQSTDFKEKCKETCLQRYGVENVSQVKEIKEKIRKTNLQRYGVEISLQSQEIQEKIQKNAKKYKEYTMPSGINRKVQGYEPFALNELIKIYKETDIITDRKTIPRITYNINDKKRYYFPDIYIPSQNKIIEVKSTWTYKSKQDNIEEKANATRLAGYDYEIWIYDNKGNKIIK